MDIYMLALVIMGLAFLGAAWLPELVRGRPLSFPFLYVAFGALLFGLPLGVYLPNPLTNSFFVERFAEILVIVSLTGAGLKLARPVRWRTWAPTWRLLFVAMPLCILLAATLGWWALGLAPASAVLLGAVLAPTDPVLASDVQVGPPGDPAEGEVRFALTSEAGLNDGLAFPFTYLAISMAAAFEENGWGWLGEWAAFDLLYRVGVGAIAGVLIGALLAKVIFRFPVGPSISRSRDGFVVLAITFLAYGVTELLHGYGFLAVFLAALTIRQTERDHGFHEDLHAFAEGIERILMAIMLILFGGLLSGGLLSALSWTSVVVVIAIVFLVRPATALLSLWGADLPRGDRLAISFFGIRGVGSLYYLAYAFNHEEFRQVAPLWSIVGLAILLSIVVHGSSASRVMRRLDRKAGRPTA